MGYSRNPSTVRKNKDLLEPLLAGKNFVWATQNPAKTAYKIRECLIIAKDYPQEFPRLYPIAEKYARGDLQIVLFGGCVHARFLNGDLPKGLEPEDMPKGIATVIDRPISVAQVVEAWIQVQPSTIPIVISNCTFTNLELTQLAGWADAQTPAWEIVHVSGERTVTLRPKTNEAPSIST